MFRITLFPANVILVPSSSTCLEFFSNIIPLGTQMYVLAYILFAKRGSYQGYFFYNIRFQGFKHKANSFSRICRLEFCKLYFNRQYQYNVV